MATYTVTNTTGDAVSITAIDSGVATAPSTRPTIHTPVGGYASIAVASDYGIATVRAVVKSVFEPASYTATIDPGLITSG
jgi:hypothetical protein